MDRDKSTLYIILFMAVITIISISLVSSVYLITEDTIRINESAVKKQRLFSSAGLDIPANSMETDRIYRDLFQERSDSNGILLYYEIYDKAGKIEGYALPVRGKGLWGNIDAFVSFYTDLETLRGIDFVSQNETPGLGARITEEWFISQFKGKKVPIDYVPEGSDTGDDEFEAITGASFTTQAVKNIINRASKRLKEHARLIE